MARHGTAFVSVWLGVEVLLLLAIVFWLEPASADLVPAPDSVPWRVGEERTVWLDTNLQAVELRVSGIDLGLGGIQRLEQGQAVGIGRSTGCLDSEVSHIALDELDADSATATFNVDYGSHAAGETLAVHHRIYQAGQAPGEGVAAAIDLTVPTNGELTASVDYTGLEAGVRHYVEASTSEHFPHEATAVVSFVPEDDGVFVVTVVEKLPSGEFHLAPGTGIGLVGCHEGEDVLVALYSDRASCWRATWWMSCRPVLLWRPRTAFRCSAQPTMAVTSAWTGQAAVRTTSTAVRDCRAAMCQPQTRIRTPWNTPWPASATAWITPSSTLNLPRGRSSSPG